MSKTQKFEKFGSLAPLARNHLGNFSSFYSSNQGYIMSVTNRSTQLWYRLIRDIPTNYWQGWYDFDAKTRKFRLARSRKLPLRIITANERNYNNYIKSKLWNYDNKFFRASDVRNNLILGMKTTIDRFAVCSTFIPLRKYRSHFPSSIYIMQLGQTRESPPWSNHVMRNSNYFVL